MNERDILAQKDFAVKEALMKGRTEGLAEGEAKGRAEGLEVGLSLDKIAFATGLSVEEVQRL